MHVKITVNDDLAAVNKIIGFDGTLINESANQYKWELCDKASIIITFYSGNYITIKLEINKDEMKNKKVDLSKPADLKKRADTGEMSYFYGRA